MPVIEVAVSLPFQAPFSYALRDGVDVPHGARVLVPFGKRRVIGVSLGPTEAKPEGEEAAAGLQQAKDYALILGLKFAYATNGREIIEIDFFTCVCRKLRFEHIGDVRRPWHATRCVHSAEPGV